MEEKPENPLPPPTNAALTVIRNVLGLSQRKAAELAGISAGTLGNLELGKAKRPLERERLEGITATWRPAPAAVESALAAVESIRPDSSIQSAETYLPAEVRADLEQAAATICRRVRHVLYEGARDQVMALARTEAASAWEVLRPLRKRPADRRTAIEKMPGVTWALVEKLAHESDRATVRDLDEAIGLAELALWAADRLTGAPELQAAAREYAWVYIGNARRTRGRYEESFAAFARAKEAAPPDGSPSPFSRARVLDSEAKLYRDKRLFPEAFALHDRAFQAAQPAELGILWLGRAVIHQLSNDPVGAVAALQSACATFDERSDPRDRWVAQFNLAANLVELGRAEEAEALLPRVRALAEPRREALDLIRVLWLEGRIAAAAERFEEAAAALDQVWRDFAALEIAFDAALAALDLAAVHLTTGRLAETKTLAAQTVAIFRSLAIEREELAAVRLFLEGAGRERATLELAREARRALVATGAAHGGGARG